MAIGSGWAEGAWQDAGWAANAWLSDSSPSAAITANLAESTIRAGGQTILLTLTDDTWVTSGATFNAQRQNILDGITGTGFIASQAVTTVVRTSDTVVTITLTAVSGYTITSDEVGSVEIPGTALTGASPISAGSFTVSDDIGSAKRGGRVKKGKKPRYAVEVDGQTFIVSSVAEAQMLLRQAEKLAETTETLPSKPPKVRVRAVGGVQPVTLQQAVESTQRAVMRSYDALKARKQMERQRDREISRLMESKLRQEQDDEDAIAALFL